MAVLRPWLDARDPWRWVDHDPESDPTVFVPFLVRLEMSEPGTRVHQSTMWTSADNDRGVYVQSMRVTPGNTIGQAPGGDEGGPDIALAGIVSGRVDIRQVPADWHQLRATYPRAYREWGAHEARELYQWVTDGLSVEDIAESLARPPQHLAEKLARVRALIGAAGSAPPRIESTPSGSPGPGQLNDHVATGGEQVDPPQRPWYDEDPELDATTYLRLILHLRRHGEDTATVEPVLWVDLRADVIRYRSVRDGGARHLRFTDVAAGWVEIRPAPADQEQLRAAYPAAYRPWRPKDALQVLRSGRLHADLTADRWIAGLGRPPHHLAAKYARLEELARAARSPGPRAEPAPHRRYPRRVDGEYLVVVLDVAIPREVAARVGAANVDLMAGQLFFATLTDEQVAALRADPDVDYLEDNAIIELR